MDALAQLALMTKAKLVFESPDTFLSFPALSPTYSPDRLTFLPAAHDMAAFSEFSMLANALPGGVLFQPSLDNTLWDMYLHVLRHMQLAQGSLTPDESAQLQQAQAVLQTSGPDGIPVPSVMAVAYSQCKQAYIRAIQSYKTQQITAQNTTDPVLQQEWQTVQEPALRAAVDAAEADWEQKGFKAEIEGAKQVVQQCNAKSPALQQQSWLSQCNPDIDFLTDPGNQTFAPTVFLPYDAPAQANWPSFTMTSAEIQKLAVQAPPELVNVVGTTEGPTIDSLSFEFCSVALSRPWFHSEVFTARFWKFADDSEKLSDGSVPPQGSWPAYVTALIFARNITTMSHGVGGTVQKDSLLTLPQFEHATIVAQPAQPMARAAIAQPVFLRRSDVALAPTAPALAAERFPASKRTAIGNLVAVPQPQAAAPHPQVMMRLNAAAFTAGPLIATPASALAPPAPSPTRPESSPPGQISILAFVCRRLPKCPDPDPNLHW